MIYLLLELVSLISLALASFLPSFLPQQVTFRHSVPNIEHWASHFCSEWEELSPNITALPTSSLYKTQQKSYFTSQQANLYPSCRLSPSTENELQDVFLSLLSSAVPFAVRAGGHAWNTGFSNTNDGITVDLSYLNKIELSSNGKSVLLGPGARWGNVYSYLEPKNLSAPGGRDANVGVGGYVLGMCPCNRFLNPIFTGKCRYEKLDPLIAAIGGGLNWFSNRVGWAVDALVSARVMLATGKIVTVSLEQNSELFWALKGSGGLVGIVTEFEMRTVEQTEFYGGTLGYGEAQVDHLIDALVEGTVDAEKDLNSVAYIGGGYVGYANSIQFSAVLANLGDRRCSEALRRFEQIPHLEGGFSMGIKNISSFAGVIHESNPVGLR